MSRNNLPRNEVILDPAPEPECHYNKYGLVEVHPSGVYSIENDYYGYYTRRNKMDVDNPSYWNSDHNFVYKVFYTCCAVYVRFIKAGNWECIAIGRPTRIPEERLLGLTRREVIRRLRRAKCWENEP